MNDYSSSKLSRNCRSYILPGNPDVEWQFNGQLQTPSGVNGNSIRLKALLSACVDKSWQPEIWFVFLQEQSTNWCPDWQDGTQGNPYAPLTPKKWLFLHRNGLLNGFCHSHYQGCAVSLDGGVSACDGTLSMSTRADETITSLTLTGNTGNLLNRVPSA